MGHLPYINSTSRQASVNFVEGASSEDNVHDYFKRLRVQYDSESDDTGDYYCMMVNVSNRVSEPCLLDVSIEGKQCRMEVDSGSAVSVVSRYDF